MSTEDEQHLDVNESEEKKDTTEVKIESNYFPKGGYSTTEKRLDPVARMLLMGVYDDDHTLSTFRGMRYIIQKIWALAIEFNNILYARYIETVRPDYYYRPNDYYALMEMNTFQLDGRCGTPKPLDLRFPKPLQQEININMMPILMKEDELAQQIPENLQGYVPWIKACYFTNEFTPRQPWNYNGTKDRVFYLTIHESFVEKGKTQRRPGLHIENPGETGYGIDGKWAVAWGGGHNLEDGLFMASNVSGSCVAWNCRILDDTYIVQRATKDSQRYHRAEVQKEKLSENNEDNLVPIGNMGNIAHLRGILPKHRKCALKGNKLYWFTDRTPHEALPMKKSGWRQFFRLVSSKLSIWYEDHSTKNPTGIKPDETITKIVKGNKFSK